MAARRARPRIEIRREALLISADGRAFNLRGLPDAPRGRISRPPTMRGRGRGRNKGRGRRCLLEAPDLISNCGGIVRALEMRPADWLFQRALGRAVCGGAARMLHGRYVNNDKFEGATEVLSSGKGN